MGYHRAGWEVVGVDHKPQPRYPFAFIEMDAMAFLDGRRMDGYDAIAASPPCQGYSAMARCVQTSAPRLIPELRRSLLRIGLPFVIENVEGAPLIAPLMLCGTMFGLKVRRHRLFEIEPPLLILTPDCQCRNGVMRGRLIGHRCGGKVAAGRTRPPSATEAQRRDAIGVPWMTGREARQAIPPAFTEFLGKQLRHAVSTMRGSLTQG
jgi:DNA (cytosine-5)-methyltransferase 1